jgi:hypothetical protein
MLHVEIGGIHSASFDTTTSMLKVALAPFASETVYTIVITLIIVPTLEARKQTVSPKLTQPTEQLGTEKSMERCVPIVGDDGVVGVEDTDIGKELFLEFVGEGVFALGAFPIGLAVILKGTAEERLGLRRFADGRNNGGVLGMAVLSLFGLLSFASLVVSAQPLL